MNAKVLVVVLFFVTNFKLCQGKNYSDYMLVSIIPTKFEQLKYLNSFENHKYMDITFWTKPYKAWSPVEAIVNQKDFDLFNNRAEHFNFTYKVLLKNLQKAFDEQTVKSYQSRRPDTFSFEHYHTLEDICMWLSDMSKTYIGEHRSIGKTSEARDITMVNINFRKNEKRPKVIVEGGIHGHEWSSVAFVTYLINELALANNSSDYGWKQFAMAYDWYLIPVANPDGYEYTHKVDRLWRKNRKHFFDSTYGVDLNRNFDSGFGTHSTSHNPIDANYCGPKPFSEPESEALGNLVTMHHQNLKYYFSIHAYGQKIIIPYDDRVRHLENFGEMENYSKQAIRKVYLRTHTKYGTGTTYDTSGLRVSGTSTNWVKKQMGVKYVYTILVRDNGTYGFALPPTELMPMCLETQTIIRELMTAQPRYVDVRSLYSNDANFNTSRLFMLILGLFIALK